jgi:hypothetical protein
MSVICKKCKKTLCSNYSLTRHVSICKVILLELESAHEKKFDKEKIKELEEELKKSNQVIDTKNNEVQLLKQSVKKLIDELKQSNIQKNEFRDEVRVYKKEIDILHRQNVNHVEKLYMMAEKPQNIHQNHNHTENIRQSYITNTKIDSKSIHNTIHLQPFDLSDEKTKQIITEALANMSEDQFQGYLKGGQKGFARAVHDLVLTKNGKLVNYYVTADASRQVFEYKSKDGQILKDTNASKLSKIVHNGLIDRTIETTRCLLNHTKDVFDMTLINNRLVEIRILPDENKKFCVELVKALEASNLHVAIAKENGTEIVLIEKKVDEGDKGEGDNKNMDGGKKDGKDDGMDKDDVEVKTEQSEDEYVSEEDVYGKSGEYESAEDEEP